MSYFSSFIRKEVKKPWMGEQQLFAKAFQITLSSKTKIIGLVASKRQISWCCCFRRCRYRCVHFLLLHNVHGARRKIMKAKMQKPNILKGVVVWTHLVYSFSWYWQDAATSEKRRRLKCTSPCINSLCVYTTTTATGKKELFFWKSRCQKTRQISCLFPLPFLHFLPASLPFPFLPPSLDRFMSSLLPRIWEKNITAGIYPISYPFSLPPLSFPSPWVHNSFFGIERLSRYMGGVGPYFVMLIDIYWRRRQHCYYSRSVSKSNDKFNY